MALDDLYPFHVDGSDAGLLPTLYGSIDLHPKTIALPWYLEEASWELDHQSKTETMPIYSSTVLLRHIHVIQNWQRQWIRTGSNPYVHPNVYRFYMPRCVQDAYTTLSTYLERTPENKMMVTRIIEDRVQQLLDDQPVDVDNDEAGGPPSFSLGEHLARVHALHVYQTIGLYDGDIRLRHVAEDQIPTLDLWARQLMHAAKAAALEGLHSFIQPILVPPESTKKPQPAAAVATATQTATPYTSSLAALEPHASTAGARQTSTNNVNNNNIVGMTPRLSQEESEWYAWTLAETIRRTWIVVTTMQTVYLTLQVCHAPCPGGSMLTARESLWDAQTGYAWARMCEDKGQGVDFVSRSQWHGMFERRRPEDMDEFAKEVLEITYGSERMERWKMQTAGRAPRGS